MPTCLWDPECWCHLQLHLSQAYNQRAAFPPCPSLPYPCSWLLTPLWFGLGGLVLFWDRASH